MRLIRFVEDLSRKTGTPTLGRAGWRFERNGQTVGHFYGDDYAAALAAAEKLDREAAEDEAAHAYWATLDAAARHKVRQDYKDEFWDAYRTAAHFALARHKGEIG